jgi:hypothetical protein
MMKTRNWLWHVLYFVLASSYWLRLLGLHFEVLVQQSKLHDIM